MQQKSEGKKWRAQPQGTALSAFGLTERVFRSVVTSQGSFSYFTRTFSTLMVPSLITLLTTLTP